MIPKLPAAPTLTTADEQAYLYQLTLRNYKGLGSVVEVGTWFGCSAGYLLAGMRDANQSNELYCFDRFTLSKVEKRKAEEQGFSFPEIEIGGDTSEVVRKHLSSIAPNFELIKTEIADITWHEGPIEILHLDAPKRWQEVKKTLEVFLPSCIPQQTVIILQDFLFPRAYALPLLFFGYPHNFELVTVPSEHGTMATFLFKEFLDVSSIHFKEWDPGRAIEIIQQNKKHFSAEQQHMLNLALAFYFTDTNEPELAAEMLQE